MRPTLDPIRAGLALGGALALGLVLALQTGCAGPTSQQAGPLPRADLHEMEPPADPPAEDGPGGPPGEDSTVYIEPPDQAALTLIQLNIDPTVRRRCGPVAMPTPMFRFDSAAPTPDASERIERLGECLAHGPLADAEVVLIGHTDPWGDGDYNRRLAGSRARTVSRMLQEEGVDADRIRVESRGERAARENPDHWPLERRVDIAVHLPEEAG